jgi:hypothetical protein
LKFDQEEMKQVDQGALLALPAQHFAGCFDVVGSALQWSMVGSISDQSVQSSFIVVHVMWL